MFSRLSALDMTYLVCIILGFVVALLLFFSERDKKFTIRWLALSYVMLNGNIFLMFLFRTGLIVELPHFFRTSLVCSLLYGPLSFLYIRTVLTQKKASKWDWLHGIPAVVYIIDYLPFFLSSGEYKISILTNGGSQSMYDISQGMFFSDAFYKWLMPASNAVYMAASAITLFRVSHHVSFFSRPQNVYWFRWIAFYLVFQVLLLAPIYVTFLTRDTEIFLKFSYVFGIMNCGFICISFFIHPALAEGSHATFIFPPNDPVLPREVNGAPVMVQHREAEKPVEAEKHAKPLEKLSRKVINQMKYDVDIYLQRHQSYLRHSYSLQELATSLSVPLYQLSALINQEYGYNFSDFINKYRIEHAVRIIKEGKNHHLNIMGLADQSGFNNRNSFTSAFKKFTGHTPSEYFKEHKA